MTNFLKISISESGLMGSEEKKGVDMSFTRTYKVSCKLKTFFVEQIKVFHDRSDELSRLDNMKGFSMLKNIKRN